MRPTTSGLGVILRLVPFLALASLWSHDAAAQADSAAVRGPDMICRVCHSDQFEALNSSPHRVLQTPDWIERTAVTPACINCHGDVSEHIASGGSRDEVLGFRDESPVVQTAVCLGCHAITHPEFDTSAHALAGMTCTSCHTQHGAALPATPMLHIPETDSAGRLDRMGPTSAICADCHDDIVTAFDFNERHRLREGALECTSCHDPHAPPTRSLLGGFKQDQCIDCHTDKGGPFVFEHPASRVEGCTACHTPHGSPNRHLLAHQQVAELCISCHATLPQFHLGFNPSAPPRFGLQTQCTNCHSAIHGSNFDPHFLR